MGDRCFWQRLLIILTFELFFDVPEQADGNWTQIAFPWSDMNRAEWADPGGLFQLDPGLVVGYGFGLGLDQGRPSGVLWVDDIELASDTSPFAPPAQEPEVPAEPVSPPAVEPAFTPEPVPAAATEPSAGGASVATAEVIVLVGSTAESQGKPPGGICPLAAILPFGAAAFVPPAQGGLTASWVFGPIEDELLVSSLPGS